MHKTFDEWWQCEGDWVEQPNVRRQGESGVKRARDPELGTVYIKRQTGHLYRDLRHPFGRPTVLRERDALAAFAACGVEVPVLVFCDTRQQGGDWQSVLVTRELAGYLEMRRWYRAGGREQLGEPDHQRLLHKIGHTLARIHRQRWQHTCLYPKHIFLSQHADADGLPHVALLDLEKCRRMPTRAWAARRDLDQLRRHARLWQPADWQQVLAGHRAGMAE